MAFDNAFHGRTMGALSMTGTPKYREGFGDNFGGVTHVPYGDLAAVEAVFAGFGRGGGGRGHRRGAAG